MLTTSPRNVRTLGFTRASASQRTMASSSTPQTRPKTLVHVRLVTVRFATVLLAPLMSRVSTRYAVVVDRAQLQNFHLAFAVRRHHGRRIAHFLVQQSPA